MTKREIKKRIYLSGMNGRYQVQHNMHTVQYSFVRPTLGFFCQVPSAKMGHAIVRTLRQLAEQKIRQK